MGVPNLLVEVGLPVAALDEGEVELAKLYVERVTFVFKITGEARL